MSEKTHVEKITRLLDEKLKLDAHDYEARTLLDAAVQREEIIENARGRARVHESVSLSIDDHKKLAATRSAAAANSDEVLREIKKQTDSWERQTAVYEATEKRAEGYLKRSLRIAELHEASEGRVKEAIERSVTIVESCTQQTATLERIAEALEALVLK